MLVRHGSFEFIERTEEIDTFGDCYKYQSFFADFVSRGLKNKGLDDLSDKDKVTDTKEYALYTIAEIMETLGTMNWKNYRELGIKQEREQLVDELVDVHKFLWGLMATWKISEDEFINQFKKKSAIVEKRWFDEHDSN